MSDREPFEDTMPESGDRAPARIGPYEVLRLLVDAPGSKMYEARDGAGEQRILQCVHVRATRPGESASAQREFIRGIAMLTQHLDHDPEIAVLAHGASELADGSSLLFWVLPWKEGADRLGHAVEHIESLAHLWRIAVAITDRVRERHNRNLTEPLLSEDLLLIRPGGAAVIAGVPILAATEWLAEDMRSPRLAPEERLRGVATPRGDLYRLGHALLTVAWEIKSVPAALRRVFDALADPDPNLRMTSAEEALRALKGLEGELPERPFDPEDLGAIRGRAIGRDDRRMDDTWPEAHPIPSKLAPVEVLPLANMRLVHSTDTVNGIGESPTILDLKLPAAPDPTTAPTVAIVNEVGSGARPKEADTLFDVRPPDFEDSPRATLDVLGRSEAIPIEEAIDSRPSGWTAAGSSRAEVPTPIVPEVRELRSARATRWDDVPGVPPGRGPKGTVVGLRKVAPRSTVVGARARSRDLLRGPVDPSDRITDRGQARYARGPHIPEPRYRHEDAPSRELGAMLVEAVSANIPGSQEVAPISPTAATIDAEPKRAEGAKKRASPPPVPASPRRTIAGAFGVVAICSGAAFFVWQHLPNEFDDDSEITARHIDPFGDVTVEATPKDAVIVAEEDGRILGRTPLSFLVPSGGGTAVLITAPGHEPHRMVLPARGRLNVALLPIPENVSCELEITGPPNADLEGVGIALQFGTKTKVPGAALIRSPGRGAWLALCPELGGEAAVRLRERPPPRKVALDVIEPKDATLMLDGQPSGHVPTTEIVAGGILPVRVEDASGASIERWVPIFEDTVLKMPAPRREARDPEAETVGSKGSEAPTPSETSTAVQ